MLDANESLFESDIERIADLHERSIEESVSAMLGGRAAERVFAYLAESPRERIFIERIEGRVESCCVVSLEPGSLDRRILAASAPGLLWDALIALISRPAFRVDAFMASQGVDAYFVRTLDDPSNRALGFYDRHGFDRIGTHSEGGRAFVDFERRFA